MPAFTFSRAVRVEATDWSEQTLKLVTGMSPIEAQNILGGESEPARCLGHWVAAVRELFEEAGIHMFVPQTGVQSSSALRALFHRLAEKRSALQLGELDFPSLLMGRKTFMRLGPAAIFLSPHYARALSGALSILVSTSRLCRRIKPHSKCPRKFQRAYGFRRRQLLSVNRRVVLP